MSTGVGGCLCTETLSPSSLSPCSPDGRLGITTGSAALCEIGGDTGGGACVVCGLKFGRLNVGTGMFGCARVARGATAAANVLSTTRVGVGTFEEEAVTPLVREASGTAWAPPPAS